MLQTHFHRRLLPIFLLATLALGACESGPSDSSGQAGSATAGGGQGGAGAPGGAGQGGAGGVGGQGGASAGGAGQGGASGAGAGGEAGQAGLGGAGSSAGLGGSEQGGAGQGGAGQAGAGQAGAGQAGTSGAGAGGSVAGDAWPFGKDGSLTVKAGNRVTIPAGSVRDFQDVTVEVGGVLEIGAGSAWTVVGVRGKLTLDGTLEGKLGEHTGGTVSAKAPADDGSLTGEPLEWGVVQKLGGASFGTPPSATGLGNADGGESGEFCVNFGDMCGGALGKAATVLQGGDGALTKNGTGKPGAGAPIYGKDGGDGGDGSGGGGGSKGRHGQLLYLKVAGAFSGVGSIDLGGSPGGKGGKGLSTGVGDGCGGQQYQGQQGGKGGGGGAGGTGGVLVLRGLALPASVKVLVGGGTGGAGGLSQLCASASGSPGQDGDKGCLNTSPGLPFACSP